jgi:hypothetical protein
LGGEALAQHREQLVEVEWLEDDAHAQPIELLGHRRVVHRLGGGHAEHQRDAAELRIEARQRQERPANLPRLFEEQILDDQIRRERLDLFHIELGKRGRDLIALFFQQLAQ